MKSTKTLILFFMSFVFVSCNQTSQVDEFISDIFLNDKIVKLKISFDSTSNLSLLDEINLLSTSESSPLIFTNRYFDTISKSYNYIWDSICSGDYSLKINSIFLFENNIQLEISSDTVIIIPYQSDIKKVSQIDLSQLEAADTIQFVYKSKGRFHDYWEKSVLIRNEDKDSFLLKIQLNSAKMGAENLDTSLLVPSSIINDIFSVQADSKLLIERQLESGVFYGSTTRQWFCLLVDNQISVFNDYILRDWANYDIFKEKYSIRIKN